VLTVAVDEQQLEAELEAGVVVCPDRSARLSPWGFARSREVRMLAGVGALARVEPVGSSLGNAVEALAIAVRAWTLRFGNQHAGGWERAVALTGGLLHELPPPPQ
jgi:hypothetical protein